MKIDETKIDYCKNLYLEQNGKDHKLIEKSMREVGYSFSTRSLYCSKGRPGWIEKYGFKGELEKGKSEKVEKSEPGAVATRPLDSSDPSLVTHHSPLPRDPSTLSFEYWLKTVSPGFTWDWDYQKLLYEKLRDVTAGKTKRLMIFMPPRHGKSELVTVRYAAWRLQKDPRLNIIVGSYNQKLANRFSRKIKHTLSDAVTITARAKRGESVDETVALLSEPGAIATGFKRAKSQSRRQPPATAGGTDIAPQSQDSFGSPLPRQINTVEEWETRSGGTVRAVGVGAGITGYGAGLVIIDDPVKSRSEAESITMRDRVFDWFNDDLYTRLEPDAPIILIQTRWHEDDLAGRLLKEAAEESAEKWDVISLPAIAEEIFTAEDGEDAEKTKSDNKGPTNNTLISSASSVVEYSPSASSVSSAVKYTDPLGRAPGEALCPQRFGLKELERIRTKLGTYSFSALYQQRPVPADGAIFKRNWFRIIDRAPAGLRWKRGYDLAISTKNSADFTAAYKCAFDKDGNLYIGDGFRSRMNYPEQRKYIIMKLMQERDVEHGIEDALHARAIVQDLRRVPIMRSVPMRTIRVTQDKVTRALSWSTLAEEGKVFIVRAGWNKGLIEEAASFPKGTNDDQIDAISIAVGMLSRVRHIAMGF
jgi:predicted phage terminase large subunit-like protein